MSTTGGLFLEIGCGDHPVPLLGDMEFDHQNPYIGFDKDRSALRIAQSRVREEKPQYDASFIIVSDLSDIGLAGNIASEVFMADFVGDSIYRNQRGVIGRVLAKSKEALLYKGRVVMLETERPPQPALIQGLLERIGFVDVDTITGEDPRWRELVDPYHIDAPRQGDQNNKLSHITIARNQKL